MTVQFLNSKKYLFSNLLKIEKELSRIDSPEEIQKQLKKINLRLDILKEKKIIKAKKKLANIRRSAPLYKKIKEQVDFEIKEIVKDFKIEKTKVLKTLKIKIKLEKSKKYQKFFISTFKKILRIFPETFKGLLQEQEEKKKIKLEKQLVPLVSIVQKDRKYMYNLDLEEQQVIMVQKKIKYFQKKEKENIWDIKKKNLALLESEKIFASFVSQSIQKFKDERARNPLAFSEKYFPLISDINRHIEYIKVPVDFENPIRWVYNTVEKISTYLLFIHLNKEEIEEAIFVLENELDLFEKGVKFERFVKIIKENKYPEPFFSTEIPCEDPCDPCEEGIFDDEESDFLILHYYKVLQLYILFKERFDCFGLSSDLNVVYRLFYKIMSFLYIKCDSKFLRPRLYCGGGSPLQQLDLEKLDADQLDSFLDLF